jgi:hypothetical protein
MEQTLIDQIKSEAWILEDLRPLFRPWQLKAYNAWNDSIKKGNKKFVIVASAGNGKSVMLFTLCCQFAMTHPKAEILYCAPAERSLSEFIRAVADVVLEHCPPDKLPHYISSDTTYRFPNGAHLTLRGLNMKSFQRRRGGKFTLAVIDEASTTDDLKEAVEHAIMPRVHKTGGHLLMSSTPSRNPMHDFESYCQEAEKGGYYFHADIYQSGKSPEEIEAIKKDVGEDTIAWQVEYLAKRGLVESNRVIIPEFNPTIHIGKVQRSKVHKYLNYMAVMDQAAGDDCAIVYGYWNPVIKKIVIEKELVVPGAEVLPASFAKAIKKDLIDLDMKGTEMTFLCDINEGIFIRELAANYDISFAKTSKTGGLDGMVKKTRQYFKDGKIIIDPSCEKLINSCQSGEWDKNRKQFARTKKLAHLDVLAALIYLILNTVEEDLVPKSVNIQTGGPLTINQIFKMSGWDPLKEEKKKEDTDPDFVGVEPIKGAAWFEA